MVMGVFGCGLAGAGQVPPEPALLTGELVCSLPAGKEKVGTAVFSPDGSRLLVCGQDVSSLWEIPSGRKVAELRHRPSGNQSSWQNHCSFSGHGTRILTAEAARFRDACFYTVWDATTGAPLGKTRLLCQGGVGSPPLLSPDGSLFLSRENGISWTVRDVTAEGISTSFRSLVVKGWRFRYAPDGRKAAFFYPGGYVSVWDLLQGKEIWSKPGGEKEPSVDVVRFSEDSSAVFVADQEGTYAAVEDLENRRTLAKTSVADRSNNSPYGIKPFSMVCFNPENKKMWKAEFPVSVMRRKWEEASGKWFNPPGLKRDAERESSPPPEIVYVTGDGHYALMANGIGCLVYNYEPVLLIWDREKNRMAGDVICWPPFIFGMGISPGGSYLHFYGGNGAREGMVPLHTGIPVRVPGKILAFSADDSMIAWQDGGTVRIWNISGNGKGGN